MANWQKLNKQFYDLLDSFGDVEWDTWMDSRAAKKAMRELELKLKASMVENRLKLQSLAWSELYNGPVNIKSVISASKKVSVKAENASSPDCKYALAA